MSNVYTGSEIKEGGGRGLVLWGRKGYCLKYSKQEVNLFAGVIHVRQQLVQI